MFTLWSVTLSNLLVQKIKIIRRWSDDQPPYQYSVHWLCLITLYVIHCTICLTLYTFVTDSLSTRVEVETSCLWLSPSRLHTLYLVYNFIIFFLERSYRLVFLYDVVGHVLWNKYGYTILRNLPCFGSAVKSQCMFY